MADDVIENGRRIIDQVRTTNISPDDAIIVDSSSGGTRQIRYSDLANQIRSTLNINDIAQKANGAMQKTTYDADGDGVVDNAARVNGKTVDENVPSGAKFTDTTYADVVAGGVSGLMTGADKQKLDGIETGATKIEVDDQMSASSTNPVQNAAIYRALNGKQDTLEWDQSPTAGSTKPVTSGGIKNALDSKQGTLTFDATPAAGSMNPVTSGGIKSAIDAAIRAEASTREQQTAIRQEIDGGWLYNCYYSVS
jgi:hypothetical protein